MRNTPLLFYVWALTDFEKREDDEISFKNNERILVIAQDEGFDDGW